MDVKILILKNYIKGNERLTVKKLTSDGRRYEKPLKEKHLKETFFEIKTFENKN